MKKVTRALTVPLVAAAVLGGGSTALASATSTAHAGAARTASAAKPTIVLVHGAFADSTSWSSEIAFLQAKGYPVVAVANPLRGVASDSAYLLSVLQTISGPIVLVGHSYAGFLVSDAAAADPAVKALVYVAAYIPKAGESPADLTYKFPGSELQGSNLVTRAEPGGTDIYINPADFASVYAGGLSPAQSRQHRSSSGRSPRPRWGKQQPWTRRPPLRSGRSSRSRTTRSRRRLNSSWPPGRTPTSSP